MTYKRRRRGPSVGAELTKLERENPDVAAAARNYDETVARILARARRDPSYDPAVPLRAVPPLPDPPEVFADKVVAAVYKHGDDDHWTGWYTDDDGLHCRTDGALVVPSSDYMIEHGRFNPE